MSSPEIQTSEERQIIADIQHRLQSIRLISSCHPRAARAVDMADGIEPIGLTGDERRAINTIRELQKSIAKQEALLNQIRTGQLAEEHRAECLRELSA